MSDENPMEDVMVCDEEPSFGRGPILQGASGQGQSQLTGRALLSEKIGQQQRIALDHELSAKRAQEYRDALQALDAMLPRELSYEQDAALRIVLQRTTPF